MDKSKTPGIFSIGGNGLVGSRITELLSSYNITSLGPTNNIDITRPETLKLIEDDEDHDFVLLLAAKADVDGCEADKELGKNGDAWKINVTGVKNVAEACKKKNKKLIYISTDFVFDGQKKEGEFYTEEDTPNPLNWYAQTKYEGEKVIQNSGLEYLILRLAYPYRAQFDLKKDFVRAIIGRLKDGGEVKALTDHFFTPTFIDDLALALDVLCRENAKGIYHVVGSQVLTPYEGALMIADVFGFDKTLISKTTREEFFAGRAPRPFNLSLKNDKISELGVRMMSFEDGLKKLKAQMSL